VAGVYASRVAAVGLGEGRPQAVLVARNHHEVDVIGHQAIGPDRNAELSARFREPIAIEFIVPRLEENASTKISPLSHVMWRVRDDDSGNACHRGISARVG